LEVKMMRLIPLGRTVVVHALCVALSATAAVATLPVTTYAGQARTLGAGVYSGEQAQRGRQAYQARCVACHGDTLGGVVGPPLTGDAFLSIWGERSLAELVDKIEKTMPVEAPGTLSPQQSTDIAAYILQIGRFPSGQTELNAAALPRVRFPAGRTSPAPAAGAPASFAAAGNLAQIMRGITFPNANIIFNVQIKDPGAQKPQPPGATPFDYVLWGSTVYPGWQAVDNAALGLIESTPFFLLPGRRCENGRPAPVDRADYRQYTDALIQVAREAYKASQSRNQDAVIEVTDKLNDACANCHKVYRDATNEGSGRGAGRCQ